MKDIESKNNRIAILKYSIKTTTSLLTKWCLEQELEKLKSKAND